MQGWQDLADRVARLEMALTGQLVRVSKGGANQVFAQGTLARVTWSTVEHGPAMAVDLAGERITPFLAGSYWLGAQYTALNAPAGFRYCIFLYKNGVAVATHMVQSAFVDNISVAVSAEVEVNGSSDYFEVYAVVTGSGAMITLLGDPAQTWFHAARLLPGGI